MKKLLLIEDSTLVLKVMNHLIAELALFEVDFAADMAQAQNMLQQNADQYFAAVVDLNLPDAPNGEAVNFVLSLKIPVLVLTASISDTRREQLFSAGIVDYVIKENRYSYEYAVRLMTRLYKNHLVKVLVVDDSRVARKQAVKLLSKYRFSVEEADGAKTAIKKLVENPEIKLVVTDYNMPEVDGFDLVRLIRSKYDKAHLIIIGLSGEGDASLSAKFIKHGANDFLRKPFNQEEFYCRVIHNIEAMETMEKLNAITAFDTKSGLLLREGFIDQANQWVELNKNKGRAIAVLSVDDFDDFYRFEFDYGNQIILPLVERVKAALGCQIIGRLSDQHLALFFGDIEKEDLLNLLDEFSTEFKNVPLPTNSGELELTLSIGFIHTATKPSHDILIGADELLRKAQESGNNNLEYL